MTSRSQKDYDSSVTVKKYLEIVVRLFLASKTNRYDKLKEDEKKIFDNLYPDISRRARFISLVSQFGEGLTLGAGSVAAAHVVAATLGMMLLSGFLTWVAFGLMVGGLAFVVATVIYKEYAVNRRREAILKEGTPGLIFEAVHALTDDRDALLSDLYHLSDYFNDLSRNFQHGEDKNEDLVNIIHEVKQWMIDAEGLLSDDAINIVKDGIIQYRDHQTTIESSDAKLKDVASDLFNKVRGKSKNKGDGRDPITKLKGFSSGWKKLTGLPIEQPEVIKKIDYDWLYRDYMENKSQIKDSLAMLKILADAMNSSDPVVKDRILHSAPTVAKSLHEQAANFAKKKLSMHHSDINASHVPKDLVSAQRRYKPVDIIQDGFKGLQFDLSDRVGDKSPSNVNEKNFDDDQKINMRK